MACRAAPKSGPAAPQHPAATVLLRSGSKLGLPGNSDTQGSVVLVVPTSLETENPSPSWKPGAQYSQAGKGRCAATTQPLWPLPTVTDGQPAARASAIPPLLPSAPSRATDLLPSAAMLAVCQSFFTRRILFGAEHGLLFNHNIGLGRKQVAPWGLGASCEAVGRGTPGAGLRLKLRLSNTIPFLRPPSASPALWPPRPLPLNLQPPREGCPRSQLLLLCLRPIRTSQAWSPLPRDLPVG